MLKPQRVFRNHYICDDCETEFADEMLVVTSSFCPCCDAEIEPYSSELVNAQRQIVLGKKSGLDSIDLKAAALGMEIPPARRQAILAQVKRKGIEKRGLLTDAEFREIAAGV